MTSGPNTGSFQIEGRTLGPGEAPPIAAFNTVSPDYFRTLGIPLKEGRAFAATDDAKAPIVAIINETLRRRLWPNESPIGKRVSGDDGATWATIVGVVGDVRDFGLDHPVSTEIFAPIAQAPQPGTLVVRSVADPRSLAQGITRAVHDVDSQTAISHVTTLEEARYESMASPRVTASLLGIFAALALLIATAGIGGIMALTVSQRVREIGIRIALGAQPSNVLRMILGQGLFLALLGVGIGLVGALALTGLVKTLLFEVAPTDPITFAGVAFVLVAAAVIASYLPARRAAAVDPIEALRCE